MVRIAAEISHITELSMQQEPYRNFIDSLDSEATKKCYQDYLSYFMNFVKIEKYEDLLILNADPHNLEGIIRDYIIHMRQDKKLSSATISARIAGISHFYRMNDVIVNWRKLKKFRGRHSTVIEDRPYTRDEIKRLVDIAPLRDKAMILLMASSGMRRGALPCLRLKDMEKIDKYNLLKFRVYRTEQESYVTFCTPECSELIHQYLSWREKLGERLTPDTPLLRKEFDTITQVHRPRAIGAEGIARVVNRLLHDSQVRISTGGRTEIMETHGFRKFFKTTCINSGMNPLYSEYLMGHKSGLTKSYFKPSDTELLEGNDKALGYVSAIKDLTINEEFRLKKKVDELIKRKDEIELMEIKHNQEIKIMRDQMDQIILMIQHNPKLAYVKPESLIKKMVS